MTVTKEMQERALSFGKSAGTALLHAW
jgi:hypothetical protein